MSQETPPEPGHPDTSRRIRALTLPSVITDLTTEYNSKIGHRDDFIWKWLYAVFPPIRLSSVPSPYNKTVRCDKVILTLFITLLDDLADVHGDTETFEQARKIPFSGETPNSTAPEVNETYLEFTQTVWKTFQRSLTDAPRYDEFEDIFYYDLRQSLNAMDYSWLLNDHPYIANTTGSDTYGPHNMTMFAYADIDIMYSPDFNETELGALRETIWDVQRLARIGNWVTTWEREIPEGDYTAGIVVRALSEGVVSVSELNSPHISDKKLIKRIEEADIEDEFLQEWDELYRSLLQQEYKTESVDITAYIEGTETVRELHLLSRGQK